MKLLYSSLKKLIPDLKASPKEAGEVFSMIGYLMEHGTEVMVNGQKDFLFDLEIRQNRPDCLSMIGLSKELAAYFGLKLVLPEAKELPELKEKKELAIGITDTSAIKRLQAIRINNVKNGSSPAWLQSLLEVYDIKSINLLVDISNYVMLLTSQPSHFFDADLIEGTLTWELTRNFKEIQTLDKTTVVLDKTILGIKDDEHLLALAGIIGGDRARITEKTTHIIMETAVYDRSLIRRNSRALNIVTEASRRLEKDLDPNNIDYAMPLLISMVQELAGGEVSSSLYDYYPDPYTPPTITFDATTPVHMPESTFLHQKP